MELIPTLFNSRTFTKPRSLSMKSVLAALGTAYTLESSGTMEIAFEYHDTRDLRLFGNGYLCFTTDEFAGVADCRESAVRSPGLLLERMESPCIDRIPGGTLKRKLAKLCGTRELISCGTTSSTIKSYSLRNRDGKIVCRTLFESYIAHAPDGGERKGVLIDCAALKGYERDLDEVSTILADSGAEPADGPRALLLLEACRAVPPGYSFEVSRRIDSSSSTGAVYRTLFLRMLLAMESNETGIKLDSDPEYIHEYRIALRKLRTLNSVLRDVTSRSVRSEINVDLRKVAESTSAVRDLDVYLEREDEYTASLPPHLSSSIRPFFDGLRAERSGTVRVLLEFLESAEYRSIPAKWRTFCGSGMDAGDSRGGEYPKPIRHTAARKMRKIYRSIRSDIDAVGHDTDDELMHRIRIDCKKLRYTLEFFSDLIEKGKTRPLLSSIRNIQDILGRYHDCTVQQSVLQSKMEEIRGAGSEAERVGEAMEHIVDRLRFEKDRCFQDFIENRHVLVSDSAWKRCIDTIGD